MTISVEKSAFALLLSPTPNSLRACLRCVCARVRALLSPLASGTGIRILRHSKRAQLATFPRPPRTWAARSLAPAIFPTRARSSASRPCRRERGLRAVSSFFPGGYAAAAAAAHCYHWRRRSSQSATTLAVAALLASRREGRASRVESESTATAVQAQRLLARSRRKCREWAHTQSARKQESGATKQAARYFSFS